MSRVSRIAAACVCAATMLSAAPAAAVPAEPIAEERAIQQATKREAAKKREVATAASAESSRIEELALSVIGAPYSWGGTTPSGFDCSGFTSWVYAHVGITLPHSSDAQYALAGSPGFTLISNIDDLQVGDLVFHATDGSGVGHVGIYVGDGMFVSATSSEGVQQRSLFDSYWGALWVGAVRVSR